MGPEAMLLFFWMLKFKLAFALSSFTIKRLLSSSLSTIRVVVALVQSLGYVWLFTNPWTAACQASLSFTISPSLCKLTFIESMIPSNHLICYHHLLLSSIFPSIRVFSNESALCIRWPKYWSFSYSISPSNKYSGLISIIIDWFDLLAVQGTLKSLLQNNSWKVSILQHSVFFLVQFSCTYMTTGNTISQSVQSLSCVRLFATPWIAARQASLSITNSGVHPNSCPSSQWCHPAISSSVVPFSSCLQSLPASESFQWVNSSHEVAKILEFQPQHHSFQWTGLISFRMDWLDLLAVQGTLKSLLQQHSSKASVLQVFL